TAEGRRRGGRGRHCVPTARAYLARPRGQGPRPAQAAWPARAALAMTTPRAAAGETVTPRDAAHAQRSARGCRTVAARSTRQTRRACTTAGHVPRPPGRARRGSTRAAEY